MKRVPGQPIPPITPRTPYSPIEAVMGLEDGTLTGDDALRALADLMNAGVLTSLQGAYQRAFRDAVDGGYIRRGLSGNWIASYPGIDGSTTD